MRFHAHYFFWAVVLFLLEVVIALYVHDTVIRPYGGDFLVTIVLYCFIRSFFSFSKVKTVLLVLTIAYGVEVSQYLHLITRLNLGTSRSASVLLGNAFSWIDMVLYTAGIATVLCIEYCCRKKRG